ncbi:MAG: helix-turn-helix domain-containing protein [Clostridia bacterium]|nr:helix-turn-helix domain-containing protein [Clostridia bacterium]
MQQIKCRKCGAEKIYAKGLCRSCYNQFYYANTKHNTTLKSFVTEKQETYYNRDFKCYDDFVKLYKAQPKIKMTAIATQLNVSRQTLYTYKKIYEQSTKK